MGWFSKKVHPLKMSKDIDELFVELTHRKHWKEIDPNIIKSIFNNAMSEEVKAIIDGNVGAIKAFIFISELHNTVANNFVKIAKDEGSTENKVSLFSLTLYRLGSDIFKAGFSAKNDEEVDSCVFTADMAFSSSILCDPFELSSYAGIAFLYSSYGMNKEAALEWCRKYKEAEDKLLNTPDETLNSYQLGGKKMLDPKEASENFMWMEKYTPELIPDGCKTGESLRDQINELEQSLLQK